MSEEDGFDLPQGVIRHLAAVDKGPVQRLVVVAGVVEVRVLSLALGNAQLEVAQLRGLALKDDVAGDARLIVVGTVDLEAAQALKGVVPDDGGGQVG